MNVLRHTAAAIAAMAGLAQAEPGHRPAPPPVARALTSIGVDDARAQKVAVIYASSHVRAEAARRQIGRPTDETTRATLRAAMEAIRSDADRQVAEVLSPEELAQFKQVMPLPPHPRGHRPDAPA